MTECGPIKIKTLVLAILWGLMPQHQSLLTRRGSIVTGPRAMLHVYTIFDQYRGSQYGYIFVIKRNKNKFVNSDCQTFTLIWRLKWSHATLPSKVPKPKYSGKTSSINGCPDKDTSNIRMILRDKQIIHCLPLERNWTTCTFSIWEIMVSVNTSLFFFKSIQYDWDSRNCLSVYFIDLNSPLNSTNRHEWITISAKLSAVNICPAH